MLAIDDSAVSQQRIYQLHEHVVFVTEYGPFPGSQILCKGYSRIVLPLLKADKQRSRVVCPTSRTEVDAFVDSALGHNTDGSSDPADIVILDQNIDLGGGDKVSSC